MEQALSIVKEYKSTKEEVDSIKFSKTIEQIYYNYQPREYPTLGAWEDRNTLGKSIQPENVLEADHYKTVKTMVEVSKASGMNFAPLCTHTVDMAVDVRHIEG